MVFTYHVNIYGILIPAAFLLHPISDSGHRKELRTNLHHHILFAQIWVNAVEQKHWSCGVVA